MMKSYAVSLIVGLLAGIVYALIDVNSPAPPVIALVGLFGMLVGEQLIPLGKRLIRRQPVTLAWFRHECVPKISGTPPPGGDKAP
ncbi:XapX domain-containing protein [Pantoea brenneri]|uniref:XapX domain-containing protein n=1 Tax=Pantoea brenneri TaxID=472694 RepID=UPI002897F5DC|nr:XapX domain-containing protein [Pantoea brenneri]